MTDTNIYPEYKLVEVKALFNSSNDESDLMYGHRIVRYNITTASPAVWLAVLNEEVQKATDATATKQNEINDLKVANKKLKAGYEAMGYELSDAQQSLHHSREVIAGYQEFYMDNLDTLAELRGRVAE